jgi:hypothetical protein
MGCSFKFLLKAGVEESIVNGPRITEITNQLFVFLLCRVTSGAFTIDPSTPTLRIHLKEHLILQGYSQMIVVEAGRARVMKFLPLSCELSIFVAVIVIF